MYKKLAGFTLEDLGLVLYRQGKTHRRRQRRTCHGSQSGWKDLSLFPYSCRHAVQSCCRSLQILKVLTLSHQLQDTDVMGLSESRWILSIYAVKVWAVKTYFRHSSDILTFFHTSVSSSAGCGCISAHVCVSVCERGQVCMCLCVHVQWLTFPSWCQIKAWKMVWSKKKGVSLASRSFSYLIDTMQLQRFMSPNIPGWVRLTATCGNMICF